MKRVLLVLLLALCVPALGQLACAPNPLGPGTVISARVSTSGVVAWWYCKSPDGTWSLNAVAGTQAWLAAHPVDFQALWKAPNRLAAMNAMLAKNMTMTSTDLDFALNPYAADMQAGRPVPASAPAASAP